MHYRCCLLVRKERCFPRKPHVSFVQFSAAYCQALWIWLMGSFKMKLKALFSSRGCLGCCNKPPIVISVDEPSKGLKIQGKSVKKASVSEDFWSSSACEIDNSTVQSQRSISLMSTSDLPLDPCSSAGTSSNPVEFVNHGLLQWNQTRQQWLAHRRLQKPTKVREPTISWNASYESLLGTNKPFSQPIPLSEMVDFLVDIWEQEGLYD